MRDAIVLIITAAFSIAAIICNAVGVKVVAETLELVVPYVTTIAVALLTIFNVQDAKSGAWKAK